MPTAPSPLESSNLLAGLLLSLFTLLGISAAGVWFMARLTMTVESLAGDFARWRAEDKEEKGTMKADISELRTDVALLKDRDARDLRAVRR